MPKYIVDNIEIPSYSAGENSHEEYFDEEYRVHSVFIFCILKHFEWFWVIHEILV